MRITVPELQPNVRYECLVCSEPIPHTCRLDGVLTVTDRPLVTAQAVTLADTVSAVTAEVMLRQARFLDGAVRLHLQHHTTQSEG